MRTLVATVAISLCSFSVFAAKAAPAPQPIANCLFVLHGNDQMQYVDGAGKKVEQIEIPAACKEFTIQFKNVGKLPKNAMGHNVLISETAKVGEVSQLAMKPGAPNDYLVPVDPKKGLVFAGSKKLLGPDEEEKIVLNTADFDKKKDYSFFCSFPGHSGIMKGKLVWK